MGYRMGVISVVPGHPFSFVTENPMPRDPRTQQTVSGTPAAKRANYTGGRPKDESKLSTDPKQIRVRLRRAAKGNKKRDDRMARDMVMLYQKPIEDWDVEELSRGRPRSEDGTFRGKTPSWITPAIVAEAKKRLLNETFGQMAGHVDLAIKTVVKIMEDKEVDDNGKPTTDARTKLAAATFVIEHIVGKPKAVIEIGPDDFTKQAIAAAIVMDDGLPQDHFVLEDVDYTVTDEEEDGDEIDGE